MEVKHSIDSALQVKHDRRIVPEKADVKQFANRKYHPFWPKSSAEKAGYPVNSFE
jgi:hypothetical protein